MGRTFQAQEDEYRCSREKVVGATGRMLGVAGSAEMDLDGVGTQ